MKIHHLLAYSVIAITLASCAKVAQPDASQLVTTPTTNTGGGTVVNPSTLPYSIVEGFEYGSKASYTKGDVTLITGTWTLDNVLIGNLAADAKDGSFAARFKGGTLSMDFDITGLKTLYISHALYGTDAATSWQLMASTDGGSTYTQLGNTINEITGTTLVVDSFKVTTTGKIRFKIVELSTSASRMNIDDITFKGVGDPGITVTVPPSNPVDTASSGSAAAARAALYGSDAPPASGDNSNLLFGNPSNASTTSNDNYLFDQHYYVESYNATRAEPNWVSWHLDASNTTSAQGRLDDFAAFSGLLPAMYAVQSNSYSGSGFDRGHNCPSADRSSSLNANACTFLMTNMIPQAPNNNQQTWGNLENYLRSLTATGYECYIIMGNYGTGGTGSNGTFNTINNGHVNVPSNVWKVAVILPVGNGDLARVTGTTRVLSVNTPNVNSINSDWTKYICTMKSIEDATGFKLLSALPANIHDAVALEVDPGK